MLTICISFWTTWSNLGANVAGRVISVPKQMFLDIVSCRKTIPKVLELVKKFDLGPLRWAISTSTVASNIQRNSSVCVLKNRQCHASRISASLGATRLPSSMRLTTMSLCWSCYRAAFTVPRLSFIIWVERFSEGIRPTCSKNPVLIVEAIHRWTAVH